MKINNVIIAPFGTYSNGLGEYFLNGIKIATNAEAYNIEDTKLIWVLNLNVPDTYSIENERLVDAEGNSYESVEEYLQMKYNLLEDLDSNINVLVTYNKLKQGK